MEELLHARAVIIGLILVQCLSVSLGKFSFQPSVVLIWEFNLKYLDSRLFRIASTSDYLLYSKRWIKKEIGIQYIDIVSEVSHNISWI